MTKKTNNSSQQVVEIDLLQVASTLWQHIISILLTGIIFGALLFGYARSFSTRSMSSRIWSWSSPAAEWTITMKSCAR